MALMSLQDATVAFGGPPLLDNVSLHIEKRERLALLGRNGAGKSTLLRVLREDLDLDGGKLVYSPGTRVAWLGQEVPRELSGPVFDIVAGGVPEMGALVAEVHRLGDILADGIDVTTTEGARVLRHLERAQTKLEAGGGWDLETRVATALSRLNLPEHGDFETLSGGLKRRVLLARALAAEPDILLLDEPTNHLDIPAIEWLEEMIVGLPSAVVLVTHDRSFLARVATRIVELDRGAVSSYPGDYRQYLAKREADLVVQERAAVKQDRRLANEEVWVRQGIKARRTRNEGRVRALERLREEVRNRRKRTGQANLRLEQSESSGKQVIELKDVSFCYPGEDAVNAYIVRNVSLMVNRADKIGILGPNGSGKSTLLKLMLGKLEPTEGSIRTGARLDVAHFDQHREQLDEDRSVADNVAEGNDRIEVDGKPQHILGYLQRFLFSPEQSRSPVSSLSGGERNRLLLARLFTRPFNVLVMDEPTNDLDVETLELLEARLVDFSGTLMVVSHDRTFLDNVVTSTLVMEGGGRVTSYAGGYSDWLEQRSMDPFALQSSRLASAGPASSTPSGAVPDASGHASEGASRGANGGGSGDASAKSKGKPDAAPASALPAEKSAPAQRVKTRKLSYKEKHDLESLPQRIEDLETQQMEIHGTLADPEIYQKGADAVKGLQQELASVEGELASCYERWGDLEG